MSEAIVIAVLIGVILYQGWQNYSQRKAYGIEVGNLLDRLMSKDYPMYIQGEIAREQVKKPLSPEEIYEMQQERGLPV